MISQQNRSPAAVPSISVAIATYQGEAYLREQLDSIQAQSVPPMEVIISDDQSEDATTHIVQEFAQQAPFPVRLLRNPARLGYAENFLRATSSCVGDLVAFCDQDDVWLERKLETCANFFEDPQVQLVCHSAQILYDESRLAFRFPDFRRLTVLPQGSCDPLENRPGFSMVIRRNLLSVLPSAGRPERLYGHDQWAWFLASLTGSVVKVPDVLCHYRQHEANLFGVSPDHPSRHFRVVETSTRYLDLARAESEVAHFLADSMNRLDQRWGRAADLQVERLQHRSTLHRMRYLLWEDPSFVKRVKTFLHLLFSGEYRPDLPRTTLGPKAAPKDFVMGVLGLSRRLSPSRVHTPLS